MHLEFGKKLTTKESACLNNRQCLNIFANIKVLPRRQRQLLLENKSWILSLTGTHPDYGAKYKAPSFISSTDTSVMGDVKKVISINHPHIIMINLPGVDNAGHTGNWNEYLIALHIADSLIWNLWQTIQSDSIYRNTTTLFVTNDHGRHDDAHGGFKDHGDSCEGCRHILCLAVGRAFPAHQIIKQRRTQCDIAPTVGELLSFPTPFSIGTSLLQDVRSAKVKTENK